MTRGVCFRRIVSTSLAAFALSAAGCVTYPQGKALVTPVGAIGYYNFAPQDRTPDSMQARQMQASQADDPDYADVQMASHDAR